MTTRTINCPNCGNQSILSATNTARPFCSVRCRNADFIDWANEEHSIPGNPTFEDLMSEDLDRSKQGFDNS